VKTALCFTPVLAASVFILIRAEVLKLQRQIYLIKPLSTVTVIAVAFISFLEPTRNLLYTIGVLAGLLFSLGGDIALMFQEKRRAFKAGLILFFTTQLIYGGVFLLMGRFSAWDILSAAILLIMGTGFYRLIRTSLGSLKGPVIGYIVAISFMVNRALSTFASPNFRAKQALMIFLGALLFYLSDVILAANRFWRPWKYHRINLAFYYSGQCLIALAASYFI
jgi:uncharacterized membrane protein YhhN